MQETRTIFLTADGRFTMIGIGPDAEMPAHLVKIIRASGLTGWLAIVSGDYYGTGPVQLARVHAVVPTPDEQWPKAVESFMATRERVRNTGR